MSRILIVSAGPLCRNPRVVKEADTLGRAGYDVTVLTVRNNPAAELVDVELLRDAPYRRSVVDLLAPDLTRRSLARVRRLRTWLSRKLVRHLGWQSPHALGPVSRLLALARAHAADLTIVHTEPAFWVGAHLLRSGRKVAAEFEDWHSEDLPPESRSARPLRLLRSLEGELLQRCIYTSTTSHALAGALHARYGGRPPVVLSNSFPLQPEPRRSPNALPVFFWFSQTVGEARGLESFFAAWRLTRHPSRVVLLGEVQPAYRQKLLTHLSAERRACVSFLPLVSPAELPALIAQYDIGLALEQNHIVNRDLTVTNKILQYLNAGLAIVATPTAGQREVLSHAPDAGILINAGRPTDFAAALDALLADPAALARRQISARRAAEEIYSWEHDSLALLTTVAAALEGPST